MLRTYRAIQFLNPPFSITKGDFSQEPRKTQVAISCLSLANPVKLVVRKPIIYIRSRK